MQLSLRSSQLIGYSIVVLVMGLLMVYAGVSFISKAVVDEAKLRVQMDLNAAWTAYDEEKAKLQTALSMIAQHARLREALRTPLPGDAMQAGMELERLRKHYGLDFLTLVDSSRTVAVRSRHSAHVGQKVREDAVIQRAQKGELSTGTVIVSGSDLKLKSNELAERAYIPLVPTERSRPTERDAEDRALMLEGAVPILGPQNEVVGTVYGGLMLNRQYRMVDKIRNAVFGDQMYRDKPLGTVTVFLWDVRIATNVITSDSARAIGTRVSSEVYDTVLERGERFADRAFVVNDWYLSAYDPIRDPSGKVIGILYVGLLEKKYLDYGEDLTWNFILICLAALLICGALALYLSGTVRRPILELVRATRNIGRGRLDTRVIPRRGSREVLELAQAFNTMAQSIEQYSNWLTEISESQRCAFKEVDEKNRAYLEMLGFVTHELKSPLASIVFAIDSLREHLFGTLNKEQEAALKVAASSAEYLQFTIANYLSLSRLEEGQLNVKAKPVRLVEQVLDPVLHRIEEMAADNKMTIDVQLDRAMEVPCDPDLMTSVFQNLLSNAVKYGRRGGRIVVGVGENTDGRMHSFYVYNDGQGFTTDEAKGLFIKFSRFSSPNYSTKSGTGLGLFVTRNIIERHGGTIVAESAAGEWARFTFTIPNASGTVEAPA